MSEKSGNKKQLVFLVVLILIGALFAAGYILTANGPAKKKIIESGDRAPEFRLQAQDGRLVSLSEFRGKVVMVHFWATWCPPCVEEIPTIEKLYRDFPGTDFEILAVSVDENGAGAVSSFTQRNNLRLPVLLDPDRATAGSYGTFKFPETYIVDRSGVVKFKVIGPHDWNDPAARKAIRDMIAASSS